MHIARAAENHILRGIEGFLAAVQGLRRDLEPVLGAGGQADAGAAGEGDALPEALVVDHRDVSKLGRPVQISVLTGTVFETLGLIDGLTKDVKLLSFVTCGCGKMEQAGLPVGFGGPYVRVSSMNVQ